MRLPFRHESLVPLTGFVDAKRLPEGYLQNLDSDSSTYASSVTGAYRDGRTRTCDSMLPKHGFSPLNYIPLVLLVGVEPTTKQILSLPPLPIGLQEQILVLLVGIEPTTYRF